MEAMLQAAVEENVQYLETKGSSYRKLYLLDPRPDYSSHGGKRYIDNDDGEIELQLVDQVLRNSRERILISLAIRGLLTLVDGIQSMFHLI